MLRKRDQLWQHLLGEAYTLHCFPPNSMPGKDGGNCVHGTKGCDKSVVMGHAQHIHGEVAFDQKQGLWFMAPGWAAAIAAPEQTDFFAWLKAHHNGAKPGEAVSSV